MLEADIIMCNVTICVALIRIQLMEVVLQEVLFNLSSSQWKAQATRSEESFTVDMSWFRLTVRMSRRIALKIFRSPSDLIST